MIVLIDYIDNFFIRSILPVLLSQGLVT